MNTFNFTRNFAIITIIAAILLILLLIIVYTKDYIMIFSMPMFMLIMLLWFGSYKILEYNSNKHFKDVIESNQNIYIINGGLKNFLNPDSEATIDLEINGKKKSVRFKIDSDTESLLYYNYDNELNLYKCEDYKLLTIAE